MDSSILAGLVLVVVGLVGAFFGYRLFRIFLPIYGAIAGFLLIWGWLGDSQVLLAAIVGAIVGLALGIVAYGFWSALVYLAGAIFGLALGSTIATSLNLWNWLGFALALVLAAGLGYLFFAIRNQMVIIITGLAGASALARGVGEWLGAVSRADANTGTNPPWLTILMAVLFVVIAVVGIRFQWGRYRKLNLYGGKEPASEGQASAPAATRSTEISAAATAPAGGGAAVAAGAAVVGAAAVAENRTAETPAEAAAPVVEAPAVAAAAVVGAEVAREEQSAAPVAEAPVAEAAAVETVVEAPVEEAPAAEAAAVEAIAEAPIVEAPVVAAAVAGDAVARDDGAQPEGTAEGTAEEAPVAEAAAVEAIAEAPIVEAPVAAAAVAGVAAARGDEAEPEAAAEAALAEAPAAETVPVDSGADEVILAAAAANKVEDAIPPEEAADAAGDAADSNIVEEVVKDIQQNYSYEDIAKFKAKLEFVEGIGPAYAAKLVAAGVNTVLDLLQRGATRKGRLELAEATGITGKLILRWVNHADLYRIKGVGSEYADLLEAAGVDTVVELSHRNPSNLLNAVLETNKVKNLVRKEPVASQIEDWVEQAKKLPRVIQY